MCTWSCAHSQWYVCTVYAHWPFSIFMTTRYYFTYCELFNLINCIIDMCLVSWMRIVRYDVHQSEVDTAQMESCVVVCPRKFCVLTFLPEELLTFKLPLKGTSRTVVCWIYLLSVTIILHHSFPHPRSHRTPTMADENFVLNPNRTLNCNCGHFHFSNIPEDTHCGECYKNTQ